VLLLLAVILIASVLSLILTAMTGGAEIPIFGCIFFIVYFILILAVMYIVVAALFGG